MACFFCILESINSTCCLTLSLSQFYVPLVGFEFTTIVTATYDVYVSGMMAWSAITTGKGLGREEITGLFAKSRFNRKYSTFSWCEEELALPEVSVTNYKKHSKSWPVHIEYSDFRLSSFKSKCVCVPMPIGCLVTWDNSYLHQLHIYFVTTNRFFRFPKTNVLLSCWERCHSDANYFHIVYNIEKSWMLNFKTWGLSVSL